MIKQTCMTKNNALHISWYSFILFILVGCQLQSTFPGIEDTLTKAQNNRNELLKVLQYFRAEGDSLKYQAALFLLENMADKYYITGSAVDEYYTFIDSVYQIKQQEYDIPAIYEVFLKSATHLKEKPIICRDAEYLSADYLINNINEAFAVWHQPWNQHLSFEEFCEYILPYRVGEELPEVWRPLFQEKFGVLMQSDTIRTAKEACTIINNKLIKLPIHLALSGVMNIDLRPNTLANIKFGLCNDYASLALFAMRAQGIPVAREKIPQWGKSNNGHVFNMVYDNDGSTHDFSGAEQNPDEHLIRFRHNIPKVYRETFGKQKESLALRHGNEPIPVFFRNPYQKDVTGEYSFINATDVVISLENPQQRKFVYLCVFNPNGWLPVAWGEATDKTAVFKDIGPDIVYQPAFYMDGKLQPTGYPFLLDTLGHITTFIPQSILVDLKLERKNPQAANLLYIPPIMVGSRFQGSNDASFRKAVTYHTITTEPEFKYTTVQVKCKQPMKFVRYQSSDRTWGNMSEVEFYTEGTTTPLTGKIIGEYIPSIYYPRNGIGHLFDGDPLSFFHSNDTCSWGGLELTEPAIVSHIRFLIRNDDNGVRKNHEYELFYMNNGEWSSLGRQIADKDDEIVFANVPQGALYWLRDYTRGQEERIFEVNNNQIIWH